MHILAVGLNYRTAPVEIRERFALPAERLQEALATLKQAKSILECVIVATCNRTEIYAVVDRHQVCGHYVRSFMEQWFGVPMNQFHEHLYIYEDRKAVEHLFRVACGLDSMIIGETQILGQVRDAFFAAQAQKTTGTLFNMLFKQAVTVGKRAQSETSIGENAVSVSYAAVELGKRIFGSFDDKSVLILGAGKMSELTLKHLRTNGSNRVYVANRTLDKARELAKSVNGEAVALSDLGAVLTKADIVISSTGADGYVLTKAQLEQAMEKRGSRPMFLIDIAVPRDLEPAMNEIPNVYLYDIDDLQGIVDSNLELRRSEAVKIETMIAMEQEAFQEWYQTLEVVPVIRALQHKAAAIHAETMESMLKKLPDLDDREIKVIRKLTKSIVNQMLHDPILRVKDMAAERRGKEAVDLFVELFALEELMNEQDGGAIRTEQTERPAAVKLAPAVGLGAQGMLART